MMTKYRYPFSKYIWKSQLYKNKVVSSSYYIRTLSSSTTNSSISEKRAERLRNRPIDVRKFDQNTPNPDYKKQVYYGDKKEWIPTLKDVKDLNKPQIFKGPPKIGWHDLPFRCGVLAMKVGMMNGWIFMALEKVCVFGFSKFCF